MKPIELTIRGLNSFREEQHIDFQTLCADGLFGIFGPTGSGKSTILDGITLALYGTVERAANNTTGIMNQLEEQMSVGFTFELSGDQIARYRAERSYKRTKDGGLRLASCRLLKLGEMNEVLADKERDLTRGVQDILGLTHDDFTRAVVLPQGKFAEFLTLKGNERRKMLQRLFHLEKYGDELSAQLKKSSDAMKQQLHVIVEKEAMLGDASQEAVTSVQNRCALIGQVLKEKRKSLEQTECEKQEQEQIWSLQEEKKTKQKTLQNLTSEKDKFDELKNKLSMNEAAEKLMPYLDALNEAEKEQAQAVDTYKEASRNFVRSKNEMEAAKQAGDQAKKRLSEEEPKLATEKQRLIQGASILEQLVSEKAAFRMIHEQSAELKRKLTDVRSSADEEQRHLVEMKKEVEKKENELSTLEVSSERRALVQKAMQEKKEIDTLDHYLVEKRGEWTQLRDALQKCVTKIEQLDHNRALADKKDASLFDKNQSIYNRAVDTNRFIQSVQSFVEMQLQKVDKEREAAYQHNLSLRLAEKLAEGQPCPVCGALHHPDPAKSSHVISDAEINNKRMTCQKAAEFLTNQQQEIRICLAQLEQQARSFPRAAQASVTHAQMSQNADLTANFAEWKKNGLKSLLNQIALLVREEKQDQLSVSDMLNQRMEEARHAESERSSLTAQAALYKEKKMVLEEQATARKRERNDRVNQWLPEYPALDQVQEEERKIYESDQQADQLRRDIQKKRKQLNIIEQHLEHDQQTLRSLESRWSELNGRQDASQKTAAQLHKQLQTLNLDEEMPIKQMIQSTERDLVQLKRDYESGEYALQSALENYHMNDKQYANAHSRLERADKAHKSAFDNWTDHISISRFDRGEDVLNAHLSDDLCTTLSEQLADYQEQTMKLSSELLTLSEKLEGKTVTENQLDETRKKWAELRGDVQTLIERYGAAAKEKETIEKNHKLFLELESERKKTQKASDQFDKLQRVFRGNAFVEFVAEEQLQQVCAAASKRLGDLTHGRYVLEVDEQGGFIIRDDGNGGIRRPVSSLSGGETFLTSLALALSLSEQIQLRGNVPLQFFFLDEGFGSLDPDLLDTVVTALEKLHMHRLSIGVISHVPEMRERLPRRLIVSPAVPSGRGSRVQMEML
jgi:exonuclease SbcC